MIKSFPHKDPFLRSGLEHQELEERLTRSRSRVVEETRWAWTSLVRWWRKDEVDRRRLKGTRTQTEYSGSFHQLLVFYKLWPIGGAIAVFCILVTPPTDCPVEQVGVGSAPPCQASNSHSVSLNATWGPRKRPSGRTGTGEGRTE